MSDSIKFGPEWLRNMSNDSGSLSSSTATSGAGGGGGGLSAYTNSQSTRFPLAEYRYGREEMLSLYDKNFKLPELLPKFNKLFIEKMQCPLALLPPTPDEETPRVLAPIGGITSERSGLGISSNSSSGSSALSGISSGRGIRGSSIDRGRGRAPRGGLYHPSLGNYQRSGFLYEEDSRGAGTRSERTWTERNGTETEWNTANGSPSPRKDFSTLRSGGSGESWRRSRVEDDGQLLNGIGNEGWRNSAPNNTSGMYKWPVRSTSWRGGENEQSGGAFSGDSGGTPPRLERSKSTQGNIASRDSDSTPGSNRRLAGLNASWDEDNLPEWAMDEPIEGGGSFDATGAFLGGDDKMSAEKVRTSHPSQMNAHTQMGEKSDLDEANISDSSKDKDSLAGEASEHVRTNEIMETTKSFKVDDVSSELLDKIESSAKIKEKESKSIESDVKAISEEKIATNKQISPGSSYKNTSKYVSGSEAVTVATVPDKSNRTPDPTPIDRLQEVAEDIEKLIMDDDHSCNESDEALMASHLHARDSHKHPSADDVLAEKIQAEMERWYYRDPQGKVQGPFTATEMLEWYRAGYFDETLNVRRVCDPQFIELGELLKATAGSIPFLSMPPIIPPLLQSNTNEINLSTTPNVVKPSTPKKPLANHLVHPHPTKMPPPTSANNPPFFDILQSQNFLGLMNPPANDFLSANSLPKHQNQPINTLPNVNAMNKQTHLKNQHQTQSLQHLLSQHKNEFNAPDQVDPMHHMLNSINHPQISPPVGILPSVPPVPTIPSQPTSQNNSFQSLIMQLQMQKPHILQQQIQQHHQQSIIMNAMNSSNLPLPHHSIDEIQQHQPAGIWDLPMPPAGVANPPVVPSASMKTEMQILEQLQAQAQAQAKAKEEQFKFEHLSAQKIDQWKKQQQVLHQPPPPQMQHHKDIQQITSSPLVLGNANTELMQPADIFRPKNDNVKELESNRASVKVTKAKTDPSIGAKPNQSSEIKTIQNFNKINNNNNNAVEIQNEEIPVEKNDAKTNKLKIATVTSNAIKPTPNEMKINQKPTSGPTISDVANKSNNNLATATAPKNLAKESTKKKSKEKDLKAAEEKRRQLEEEEEKRRLELIAAQRKAKLVDQNAIRAEQQGSKRNNLAASVAPWSNLNENAAANPSNSALTMAEIQKAERERRSEMFRLEQANQQSQAMLEQQQQKDSPLKWKLKPQANLAKSLAEIQAEESKARTIQQLSAASAAQQKQQHAKKDDNRQFSQWSMIWGNDQGQPPSGGGSNNAPLQSGNGNANCFWEDPSKAAPSTKGNVQQNGTAKPLAKSQTVSNMQSMANNSKANQNASKSSTTISKTSSSGNVTSVVNSTSNNNSKKAKSGNATSKKDGDDEFGAWCAKALAAHNDVIDVPTFVSFLRDIESPFEVKDYIRMYLGETKECGEFAKHFLERRSKYKNQQRAANAHIDDMCSPAPAITPASDGQEAKGKAKKEKKKNKMTKLDSRILGFSVGASEDRLNVGARDYAP